jgi:hypothetical protein
MTIKDHYDKEGISPMDAHTLRRLHSPSIGIRGAIHWGVSNMGESYGLAELHEKPIEIPDQIGIR